MTDWTVLTPRGSAAIVARQQNPSSRTVDYVRADAADEPSGFASTLDEVEAWLRQREADIHETGTSLQRLLEAAQDLRRGATDEAAAVQLQAQAVTDRRLDRPPSWFGLDTVQPGLPNGVLILGALALGGLAILFLSKGGK